MNAPTPSTLPLSWLDAKQFQHICTAYGLSSQMVKHDIIKQQSIMPMHI